ncbi:MAG: UDP-N-acetylmuramate--L-alanine ligase [Pseudomonadota bacterium]
MKNVHLMGIGGTGMVALAGLFVQKGWGVRGSDKDVYPPASDELARLKVEVRSGFRPENLEPRPDLVVVGNVISRDNVEAQALLQNGIPYVSMAAALRDYFLAGRRSIVVAGTHGKSTSTALLAWMLEHAGKSPGFFVGGFPLNFGSGCRLGEGKPFVIEGDEYDTAFFEKTPKFLHYRPEDVIITSIEFDHADIYRDLAHVIEQFEKLLSILPPDASIVACGDDPTVREVVKKARKGRVVLYGLAEGNEMRGVALKPTRRGMAFGLEKNGRKTTSVDSPLLGAHNVRNALGCLAMAEIQGVPLKDAAAGLSAFRGLRRRQEFLGEFGGVRIYDDFAHHPTAIANTLAGFEPVAKNCGGRLWAVFEPRSNTSRRRVFQKSLPESFRLADEVILAPVYKKPDALQDSELLEPAEVAAAIARSGRKARAASTYEEIVQAVASEAKKGDVVVFMSNGAFGGVPRKTGEALAHQARVKV